MANDNIIRLPTAFTRTDMSPEEALGAASNYDWEQVIIVGFCKDSESLTVCTSKLSRRDALWIAEHLKKHVLGDLD